MNKKDYWYQRLSRWTVIIGLGLTGLAHASDNPISKEELEKQFVDKALADYYVQDLQKFSSDATRFYEPLAKVEKELQELPIKTRLEKEEFEGNAFQLWLGARCYGVSHPLLQAVCLNKQRKSVRTQSEALADLKQMSTQLLFAEKSYPVGSLQNLKILMMAAFEATEIDRIVTSFGFAWPKDAEQCRSLSSMMYLPVQLWRQVANHPHLQLISARDLWHILPSRRLMHSYEEPTLHWTILDNIREKIPLPAFYEGSLLHQDDESDAAWNKEKASRKVMVTLFRAHALMRANNFAAWHLRCALRLGKKVGNDYVRMVPYISSQEDELGDRFAISQDISQCLSDLIPCIDNPFVKTQAAHMAAELRAWPHRSLKSGLWRKPFDETILSDASAKIFKRELSYAAPFLQEMQEAVIEHAKDLDLAWENRLMVVRAYYGLAMLASETTEKRTLLEQALELSKLREGEHDPARCMDLLGHDTGNYRYNHGDLYQGLEFPTWENAITLRLKELDEKEKK